MIVRLLASGAPTVTFKSGVAQNGWVVTGLTGWIGSPDSKVQLSEREAGDGAHDIPVSDITYAARTVGVSYAMLSELPTRDLLISQQNALRRMLHRHVTVEVSDGGLDTFAQGYVSQIDDDKPDGLMYSHELSGTVSIVCARPEILSTSAQKLQVGASPLAATSGKGVGLRFSPKGTKSGTTGLRFAIAFADGALPTMPTTGVLRNNGTSPAYPVFTCVGPLQGVRLTFGPGTRSLWSTQVVGTVPMVLDCRSRTAEIAGLSVDHTLKSRNFPVIPPGGELPVELISGGSGYVTAEVRDTYM